MIPRRSRDNWGSGYYHDTFSEELKDSLVTGRLRNEQGWEAFYNFAVTPWLGLGADVQIIGPALAGRNAVFAGLRTTIRF